MLMIENKLKLDILVVEDDSASLQNALTAYNKHNVVVAKTVEEAMEKIRAHRPDYIVSGVFLKKNENSRRMDNTEQMLSIALGCVIPLCFISTANQYGLATKAAEGYVTIAPISTPDSLSSMISIQNSKDRKDGFSNLSCDLFTLELNAKEPNAWALALDCIRNAQAKNEGTVSKMLREVKRVGFRMRVRGGTPAMELEKPLNKSC